MIDSRQALTELADEARRRGLLALDTEFVWEQTYYPQLGLIQAGFSSREVFLIDTVKLEDLAPLGDVLADPNVAKILHDAQQDLTILRRATGASPKNVFDTQRAAGFIGLSATSSLADLIRALFDVSLPKTATRTNWLQRPLSDEQVAYALDDVRYLPEAMRLLEERAEVHGRLDWVREEMAAYDDPALYEERDPDDQFERVSGRGRLSSAQLAVLRELAAWRENEARRQDRPRGHIVPDDVLSQIARSTPRSSSALRSVRGRFERERYEEPLLEAVRAGLTLDPRDRPRIAPTPPQDEALAARIDLLLAYIKGTCLGEGIDPQLIGTRADVTSLARDVAGGEAEEHPVLTGWRKTFIGSDLLQLLSGELAVSVDPESGLPRRWSA